MASLTGIAFAVAASFLSFASTVTAKASGLDAPGSPDAIGSDLTILTHNDLYGNSSPRQAATIVISTPLSHADALYRCAALEETLWNPANSSQDLGFLRYLDYNKTTDDVGMYWIGAASECRTIDTHGQIRDQTCDSQFPALCSQSASLSSPASADTSPRWQTSVRTGNATVLGYRDKLSFRFLGLKYGETSRFMLSGYVAPVGNVSALTYGPRCIQSGCTRSTCSEDCLYLNIWTPFLPHGKPSPKKKAVMLWIHGGGFTAGEGSDPTFDGGNMASRGDVVVVTINYRLSTLGFLVAPGSFGFKGNYGISDQIRALDWIRDHIEDFGGDRNRITVFGQSAGAASVRALISSSLARTRFSSAIMQSNPAGLEYAKTFSEYLTINEAAKRYRPMLAELGCISNRTNENNPASELECLMQQDPFRLVGERDGKWTGTVARYPVVDGFFITLPGLLLDGRYPADIAVMAGAMRDDGSPFSKYSRSNASQALTEQGFNATDILGSGQFPLSQSGNTTRDVFNLTSRVATNGMFRCLGQSTAYVGSKNKVFPVVYQYEFDRGYQISEWSPNSPACEAPASAERPLGDTRLPYFKCHSGELYYVFGTLIRQGRQPRDQDDIPFSQYIVDTWTAFAREKNPNPKPEFLAARGFTNTTATVAKSSQWKPVEAEKPMLRILDVAVKDEGFREVEQCAVLDLPLDYYPNYQVGKTL